MVLFNKVDKSIWVMEGASMQEGISIMVIITIEHKKKIYWVI